VPLLALDREGKSNRLTLHKSPGNGGEPYRILEGEKTLKISISRDGLNVNHLEEILLPEVRRFGKELWERVLASLPVLPARWAKSY